jgi:hypothetical protein
MVVVLWFALNGVMAYIVYSDCLEHTQSGWKALLWAFPVFALGVTTLVLGLGLMMVYFCVTSMAGDVRGKKAAEGGQGNGA